MITQTKMIEYIDDLYNSYNNLLSENKEIKSETYKDDTIQKLKEENKNLLLRCGNYGLSQTQYNKLNQWYEKHCQEYHNKCLELDSKNIKKVSYLPEHYIEIREFAECTCYTMKCGCGKCCDVYL